MLSDSLSYIYTMYIWYIVFSLSFDDKSATSYHLNKISQCVEDLVLNQGNFILWWEFLLPRLTVFILKPKVSMCWCAVYKFSIGYDVVLPAVVRIYVSSIHRPVAPKLSRAPRPLESWAPRWPKEKQRLIPLPWHRPMTRGYWWSYRRSSENQQTWGWRFHRP